MTSVPLAWTKNANGRADAVERVAEWFAREATTFIQALSLLSRQTSLRDLLKVSVAADT
jgi:hypothetical protein